jgi:hypothetical protein
MSKSINGEHHKPREQVKNLDLEKPAKDSRGRRGWRKKETVCKYSFFKEFSASPAVEEFLILQGEQGGAIHENRHSPGRR